ncbi:hypothetical protein BGX21_000889 [Mortierella sp. AD011]|nr:hypothetical protein BGX21_000889 [Mortierella sp. AD011]
MAKSPEINVLLLGETQSGKSTFIEFVKKYADPDYAINLSNIGGSVSSSTEDVVRSTVHTNLPITKMVKRGPGSSLTAINLGSLINDFPDVDDFEDTLNQRNIKIVQTPSSESPKQYLFNFFDTPGLNDTRGGDEEHIASIYKVLRSAGNIHLVLVTIGNVPFSPGFKAATMCYFDMFPEFHGLVAFVHTHFDYKNFHPQQEDFAADFTKKKAVLNDMMRRNTCQHFEIDCDINSKRPIRIGITQNIIRRIISLAPFNQPVAMDKVLILKSPKMKVLDSIIADKYKAILDAQRATLDFKDGSQGDILRNLYEMETRLSSLRSEVRDLKEHIKEYNTSDLIMIYESTFDESWRFFQINIDHSMDFPVQKHIIHKKSVLCENVEISKEQGGEGHSYWNIVYRRHSYEDGTLHAKLYATRSSIYREQISDYESKLSYLRSILQGVEKELAQYSFKHQSEMTDIQKLVELNTLYTRLISRLLSERLSPEVFQRLVDAKAYASGGSETVERMYLEVVREDEVQEFVKKYADPDYTIDLNNIGDGISPCTKGVIRSPVHTDLPIASVVGNASGPGPREDYLESLINDWPVLHDFENALDRRKDVKTIRIPSSESPTQYQFNLFDTPGLHGIYGEDEVDVANIYKALRAAGHIHLVLVAIGKEAFTSGFQDVIKCYFDMLPELHGLTAFVHTHVDYKDLHPAQKGVDSYLPRRIKSLDDMIEGDLCPHFAIDCDLNTTKPIRECISQHAIRNILSLALSNKPVTVKEIQIYKSPKMKTTDKILVDKYRAILDAQKETRNFKDETHGTTLWKPNETGAYLEELRSEERDLEEYIKEHDTSDSVTVYEYSFDEEWKVFHRVKVHHMEFPNQEYIIQKESISSSNVRIVEIQGGEGKSYWRIKFKRHCFRHGFLHAKLYTTKAWFHRKPLSTHKSRLNQLREILDSNWQFTQLISRLSDEKLIPDVFLRLVDEKAYIHTPSENSETVESTYLDITRNDKAELLEQATA